MPTVASTSPAVLMAHLAASTSSIKVGSGGVMLPNHAPLVVAEQFAMLEALHPGRIDLGIGRAPGTDPATAAALRRSPDLGAEDFPRDLLDLMGLLGDERVEHGGWSRFRATPVATSSPQIILLGSSGYSAQVAGQLGLAFGFAHHFDLPGVIEAVRAVPGVVPARRRSSTSRTPSSRRACWRPTTPSWPSTSPARPASPCWGSAPAGGWRCCTPTTRRRTRTWRPPGRCRRTASSATAAGVASELQALAERTGAKEIMVSTMTHGLPERIRTLELIAEHWPR